MDKFWPFVQRHWALSVAFVVVFIVILFYEKFAQRRDEGSVTPEEAVRLMNRDNALVIDIRAEALYEAGHILKSRHIPLKSLGEALGKLAKMKSKPVVLVGSQPAEIIQAKKQLEKAGFNQVASLRGGLKAWSDANLPLEK